MYRFMKYVRDRLKGKAGPGQKRSKHWRKAKKEYYSKHGRKCSFCGTTKKVELHHILPFHLFPDLELDEKNLIPLCDGGGKYGMRSCHFFAHLGDWKKFNPNIREDCDVWASRLGWQREDTGE